MKAARSETSFDAIANAVKSKRYPMTRIHRLLLCAYLGITDEMLKQPIPYVRVLAAGEYGRQLLRNAKALDNLPLVNAGQTPPDDEYFQMECRAADLFTLFAAPGFPPSCKTEQNGRIILG